MKYLLEIQTNTLSLGVSSPSGQAGAPATPPPGGSSGSLLAVA